MYSGKCNKWNLQIKTATKTLKYQGINQINKYGVSLCEKNNSINEEMCQINEMKNLRILRFWFFPMEYQLNFSQFVFLGRGRFKFSFKQYVFTENKYTVRKKRKIRSTLITVSIKKFQYLKSVTKHLENK